MTSKQPIHAVPFPQAQSRLVFQRMSRYLGRIAKSTTTNNVHKFRTNSRRVEALVAELAPENGNRKKLLKLLSKLRKKAGKVRDFDVQIAFLKELRIPDRQNHRAQLMEWLVAEQSRRTKKLAKSLDAANVQEIRKRLRRAQSEVHLDEIDPLQLAYERLPRLRSAPLNERTLHACRIEAKRARYLAELAPDSPDSRRFVEGLKRAQDAIGQWHDVLKLKQEAEKLFGSVNDSALVAALQNIMQARFRRAASALITAVSDLSQSKKPVTPAGGHKSDDQALRQTAVA